MNKKEKFNFSQITKKNSLFIRKLKSKQKVHFAFDLQYKVNFSVNCNKTLLSFGTKEILSPFMYRDQHHPGAVCKPVTKRVSVSVARVQEF